jgi:hypothetical protein
VGLLRAVADDQYRWNRSLSLPARGGVLLDLAGLYQRIDQLLVPALKLVSAATSDGTADRELAGEICHSAPVVWANAGRPRWRR